MLLQGDAVVQKSLGVALRTVFCFCLFFSLADCLLSVNQRCSGSTGASLTWSDPEKRTLCPSLTVACQHLSRTILSKRRLSPFPSHIPPPLSLATTPWQQFFLFIFFFLDPHSTKCVPQHLTAGQKKSESACCLDFLGTLMHCQCRKKWRRGGGGWGVTWTRRI